MTIQTKKFTSTIAGASILLTTVGLLSRGLGLVREIVFAGSFGLSAEYDLFLVGTIIPLTINTIVIYIAQNYFIPVYNRLKANSPEAAKTFIVKSLVMFVLGGILVFAALFFLSEQIIQFYLNSSASKDIILAVRVFKIYSLTIPLNAAFSIMAAFLYSEFDFKLPTFSQLFVNVSVIIVVIFFSSSFGVVSIAAGYLIGIIFQLLITGTYIIRSKLHLLSFKKAGYKLFYWDSGLILIIIIESLSQVYIISDRYFLSDVAKGGIAALNYSLNLFQLPVTIISAALSTALFPSFSKSFVENNITEIKGKLGKFFTLNLYIFIPLTLTYVFFGDALIILLFQRGAFSLKDSYMTFETLKYLSISLIFYSSYSVINKLLYSMELVKHLLIITILGCSIKILCNFILVKFMGQDGLALSSSISYIFFFVSSLILVKFRLNFSLSKIFLHKLLFILLNAFLSYFISHIIFGAFISGEFSELIKGLSGLIIFVIIFGLNTILIENSRISGIYRIFSVWSNLRRSFTTKN